MRWVKYTSVSRMVLYCAIASVSLVVSRTISPLSGSSTMSTSSGLAIFEMSTSRTCERRPFTWNSCFRDGACCVALSASPPACMAPPPPPVPASARSELYRLAANECQYSRQILKISLSGTAEIFTR